MSYLPLYAADGQAIDFTDVDASDFLALRIYQWRRTPTGYAVRTENRVRIYLHRQIMGLASGDGLEVDHIDGDKLNNRRSNLRVCTRAENGQNLPGLHRTSRFRGVCRRGTHWQAQVWHQGRNRHLGTFDTEEEAAAISAAFRAEHLPFATDRDHHPTTIAA